MLILHSQRNELCDSAATWQKHLKIYPSFPTQILSSMPMKASWWGMIGQWVTRSCHDAKRNPRLTILMWTEHSCTTRTEGNPENQSEVHCTILSGKISAPMISMVAVAISSPINPLFLCARSSLSSRLTDKKMKQIYCGTSRHLSLLNLSILLRTGAL